MEKLIKLLNEHRAELLHWNIQNKPMRYSYGSYVFWLSDLTEQNCILLIISKEYGFIKWLVDNDKITTNRYYIDTCGKPLATKEEKADILISKLAISDTPIEDLISYLK